jgi:SAM-dependent methyltransferase
MYGQEKWVAQTSTLKRWGYRLFGELHVPGRIRGNHITRELERLGLPRKKLRVLDAGCGRGDLAIYLARRYPHWEVVGIELSEERAAVARKSAESLGLKNVQFRLGSLEDFEDAEGFDLIISADVLEHIENDRAVIKNLFRALRPNGFLIITSPSVPQRKHLWLVHWRERRIGFKPSDYGHVRDGYSKQDVKEKFEEAGGSVVHSYFTYGFFGTLAFDIFFVLGDNEPNPLVFAAFFPGLLFLGYLDLFFKPEVGSAILAVGTKNGDSRLR